VGGEVEATGQKRGGKGASFNQMWGVR